MLMYCKKLKLLEKVIKRQQILYCVKTNRNLRIKTEPVLAWSGCNSTYNILYIFCIHFFGLKPEIFRDRLSFFL